MNIIVGPVLLDFPYVFKLDGNKLYCTTKIIENGGRPCGGVIDYDDGFNNLKCTKCGRLYLATELKKEDSLIILNNEEDLKMKVQFCKGDKIIKEVDQSTDYINLDSLKDNHKPRSFKNETIKKYTNDNELGTIILASRPKNAPNKKNVDNKNIKINKDTSKSKPKYVDEHMYKPQHKEEVVKELVINIESDESEKIDDIEDYTENINVKLGVGEDFDTSLRTPIEDLIISKNENLDIDNSENDTNQEDMECEDIEDSEELEDSNNDEELEQSQYEEEDNIDLIETRDEELEKVIENRRSILEKYGLNDDDFRDLEESPTFQKMKKKKSSAY